MQLQTAIDWLPQLAIAAFAGFIHQWLATRELIKSLRRFPFFSKNRSSAYWAYRLFSFLLAAFVFWAIIPTVFRIDPPSAQRNWKDLNLWGMALAVGFYFRHFLDAPISLVALGVFDIGPGYHKLMGIFRDTIVTAQRDNTQDLWADVGKKLREADKQTKQKNYISGHQFLRDSLIPNRGKNNEIPNVRAADLKRRLDAILPRRSNQTPPPSFRTDLSDTTIELLNWLLDEGLISCDRLPQTLEAFGCHQCAQKYFPAYFPNATKGSRPRS